MNKETVKITSLVAGILTAVVALFVLIEGIITLTSFSGDAPARYNVYIALAGVLQFAVAAGLGVAITLFHVLSVSLARMVPSVQSQPI